MVELPAAAARTLDGFPVLGSGYLEIVGDFEDAGDGVGADVGDVFVGLGIDDAGEGDVAVDDGDADGFGGVDGVAVELGGAVDGAGGGEADTVVHGGDGGDLDVVDEVLDAGIIGDEGGGGVFVDGAVGDAAEGDDSVFDADGDGVEGGGAVADAIVGELFGELVAEGDVFDLRAGDLDLVVDGFDAFAMVDFLVGFFLVGVEVDGAGEGDGAVGDGSGDGLESACYRGL